MTEELVAALRPTAQVEWHCPHLFACRVAYGRTSSLLSYGKAERAQKVQRRAAEALPHGSEACLNHCTGLTEDAGSGASGSGKSPRKVVLPRYGFEGSPKAIAAIAPWQSHSCSLQGVFDMLQQFDRPEITSNAEFQQQADRVEECPRRAVVSV